MRTKFNILKILCTVVVVHLCASGEDLWRWQSRNPSGFGDTKWWLFVWIHFSAGLLI